MKKLIHEINNMGNRGTLAILEDAIRDTEKHGYTGAVVILTDLNGGSENVAACMSHSGLHYVEVLSVLQSAILSVIADANDELGEGDIDVGGE